MLCLWCVGQRIEDHHFTYPHTYTHSDYEASVAHTVRSQARPRVAKVHRLRTRKTKQFAIESTRVNGRTIQRHKKMALLRGSFTDEEERDKERQEAPFDHTRRRVCSQSTMSLLKSFLLAPKRTWRGRNSFLGKEKKAKAFSFSIKRNLYSSCSRIYSSIVKSWHS